MGYKDQNIQDVLKFLFIKIYFSHHSIGRDSTVDHGKETHSLTMEMPPIKMPQKV